jgi:glycosyltransferase involved in cell wall biosynthesis
MSPRFSILLPTHNRADVLGYAIRSVLRQTEGDFELLVVGDGCTDGTGDLVTAFDDARIRWFDLPKAPHFGYANRNIALRQATGEYIAFMAHDDLVLPDHLSQLRGCIERTDAEWVYSRPLWVTVDGVVIPLSCNLLNRDELEFFLSTEHYIPAPCVMYRRSCLDKYGYWPEDTPVAADWRHWIRIIEGGHRSNIGYCPTPTTLHFRANWRRGRIFNSSLLEAALEIADASAWWPAALKLAIPQGVIEQSVFFAALERPGYIDELRKGVGRVIDRFAWDEFNDGRKNRELEASLRAVYRSRSWKLTAPLRAIARALHRLQRAL